MILQNWNIMLDSSLIWDKAYYLFNQNPYLIEEGWGANDTFQNWVGLGRTSKKLLNISRTVSDSEGSSIQS